MRFWRACAKRCAAPPLPTRSQLYKDVASGPFFGYNQPGARHFSEVRLAQAGSLKAFAGCGLGDLVEGDGHGRFRLRVCAQTTPGAQQPKRATAGRTIGISPVLQG